MVYCRAAYTAPAVFVQFMDGMAALSPVILSPAWSQSVVMYGAGRTALLYIGRGYPIHLVLQIDGLSSNEKVWLFHSKNKMTLYVLCWCNGITVVC